MKSIHAEAVMQLARVRSYLRLQDVASIGVPRVVLTRLVRCGQLERVGRGLYRHPAQQRSAYDDLIAVANRGGRGVFCLLSALHFHGVIPAPKNGVWLALPKEVKQPHLNSPHLYVTRFYGRVFAEGIEVHCVEGFSIRVYSLEKTLADCFKFRNKVGLGVALNALKRAWLNRDVELEKLLYYAGVCRVDQIIRPYLNSLIWLKRGDRKA